MKQSQIDRAIANLEAERAVLDLAIQKMKAQREAKPAKVRKAKPVVADEYVAVR